MFTTALLVSTLRPLPSASIGDCDEEVFVGAPREGDVEMLHRVAGAVDVAREIIERSSRLVAGQRGGREQDVLAKLVDASGALGAVSDELDDQLRRARVGPAA